MKCYYISKRMKNPTLLVKILKRIGGEINIPQGKNPKKLPELRHHQVLVKFRFLEHFTIFLRHFLIARGWRNDLDNIYVH